MLAVEQVRFAYRRGGQDLFAGLSHAFTVGKVTALTGPSGRGKSTLLYVLGLMLRPTAGTVLVDGESAASLSDATRSVLRARRFGFVFQDAALDPRRSILESVIEPARYAGIEEQAARRRARSLLDEMGIAHRADHLPGEISGGQAQRVAVCRALVNNPGIILADEPTGNLDRDNAAGVLTALAGAAGAGRTVVIATHDPFVIDHSDEIVTL